MATFLITGPFPELWKDIEHEHLVLVDGHGLDGKPWLEGPNIEIAPVADILMEDIDKDGPIIDALCDSLLLDLAESLNQVHGVDEELRFWRMVLAPWIRETVMVIYVREKIMNSLLSAHPDAILRSLSSTSAPNFPVSSHAEVSLLYHQPHFTSWLIGSIWRSPRNSFLTKTESPVNATSPVNRHGLGGVGTSDIRRRLLVSGANWSKRDLLRLYASSRILPVMTRRIPISTAALTTTDYSRRALQLPRLATLRPAWPSPIVQMVPSQALEGFSAMRRELGSFRTPLSRMALATNAGLSRDFSLRLCAAEIVKHGGPVYVFQEGGGYGTRCIPDLDSVQADLATRFFSWGHDSHPNGHAIGVFHYRGIGRRWSKRGHIALLLGPSYLVAKDFASIGRLPTSSYLSDIEAFVGALPAVLRSRIVIRSKSSSDGRSRKGRIMQKLALSEMLDVRWDNNVKPIGNLIRRSQLSVITYNESLFPILIARDLPVICLWNRHYSNPSRVMVPLLQRMSDAGLYFSDPRECARHVEAVVDDVETWWNCDQVRSVRGELQAAFALVLDHPGAAAGRAIRASRASRIWRR